MSGSAGRAFVSGRAKGRVGDSYQIEATTPKRLMGLGEDGYLSHTADDSEGSAMDSTQAMKRQKEKHIYSMINFILSSAKPETDGIALQPVMQFDHVHNKVQRIA